MHPLKAVVRNGRLVVDEPTALPEGTEIELVPIDDVLAAGADDLDDEELSASIAEGEAGQTEDFATVLAELRQRQ
jgi:hypothetical protein